MKLHLPKMLLTAVVAAICCVPQSKAADYSVYSSTDITNPETGEITTSAYGYGIVQWTGGANTNKPHGICYPHYHLVSYDNRGLNVDSDAATPNSNNEHWRTFVTGDYYTFMFDANSTVDNTNKAYYDIDGVKWSGIIVTDESNVSLLWANATSGRNVTIGKAGDGAGIGYTTIARNFTLDLNTNSLTLAGTQVWNIDDGAEFTIQNTGSQIINAGANLTVNGEGSVSLKNSLTNNGTLTIKNDFAISKTLTNNGTINVVEGGKIIISSLDGFEHTGFQGVDYTAANGVQTVTTNRIIEKGTSSSKLTSIWYNGEETQLTNGMVAGTAAKAYVITSGTVTAGGNEASEHTADVDVFAVGAKGTLNIAGNTSKLSSSQILLTSEGTGKMVLSTTAGLTTGQSTVFQGALEIATGGTLNFGQAKAALSDMSSLASVVLDGGTLNYHATGSTINNLTVTANGGTFAIEDLNNNGNSIPAIQLDGTTMVNGALQINQGYKGRFEVEHLTGSGSIALTTANSDGFGTIANISSMAGFSGTLNLTGKADHKITVNATLDKGYTLNASQIVMSNSGVSTVNLTGSGTYNLGAVAENASVTSLTADNSSVKLAQDWTGTVKLSGGEHQTGASQLNKCVQNINFNDLGRTGSTVEITSNGLYGYFVGSNQTFNPNIKLTGDLYIQNGSGDKKYTFAGQISGDGSMKITRTTGGTNDLNFTGDIQHWKGELDQSGSLTTNIGLSGSATEVNAAIKNTGSGTLNLTVNNSGKTTSFNKEVTVSKLEVKDGSTISLGATTKADTFALNGGKLEFSGGTLSVASSITLDANSISLKSGMDFTSASDVMLMTVTNGTLTVNNVGSWTGSTYEIDGRNYTTSLSVEDNTLQLKFTAEPLDSMDVYISLNGCTYDSARDMLMLVMVDANGEIINDISRYYNVVGIHGEGSWDDVRELVSGDELVGLSLVGAGTPVVGDGASNVGFYGSYKGEGNGQYTDKGQAIPEPATATLSLLALCGLAARRRRRA